MGALAPNVKLRNGQERNLRTFEGKGSLVAYLKTLQEWTLAAHFTPFSLSDFIDDMPLDDNVWHISSFQLFRPYMNEHHLQITFLLLVYWTSYMIVSCLLSLYIFLVLIQHFLCIFLVYQDCTSFALFNEFQLRKY